ncbi:MAG: DUF1926 domain-containing protein [Candidatus Omnitrophica bacterium]|nr:DUF1926 domain-containing protein [Candidatus Omnitrophota bacterium]
MDKSINLLFGVHNHQPVGNFVEVFKKATQECYRPFISTLYKFPQIKCVFHLSGSLIDWLLKNDPDLLKILKEMLQRGQCELLTGGYYEPVFTIIPQRDINGQIQMMSDFIRGYFEYEPQGMWLSERVWQPKLSQVLSAAGVKYVLLDDFHFINAKIAEENLFGYYIDGQTEQPLAFFPISKKLRYMIPFWSPAKVIAHLKGIAGEHPGAAATIVDDGEKFGLWPGTYKLVYRRKWLESFLRLLSENKHWLRTATISEYMSSHKPLGKIQIPAASYEEMMTWSEGRFENFFKKYPEANNLYSRMLYVSERLEKANPASEEGKKHLYLGQCNCPYWHGVFGGIYLSRLRHTAYSNLIIAERVLKNNYTGPWIEKELIDFDKDGSDELIVRNPQLNVFITPALGGGIFELDYVPKNRNIMDVMTRRPEPYHQKIPSLRKKPVKIKDDLPLSIHDLLGCKERGLEAYLQYDSYRRLSLLDHFLPIGLPLTDFKNNIFEEQGDFLKSKYSLEQKEYPSGISVILQRQGVVSYSGRSTPISLKKVLSFNNLDAKFNVRYELENLNKKPVDIVLAVEFNIAAESQGKGNYLYCYSEWGERAYPLTEDFESKGIRSVYLYDACTGIKVGIHCEKFPELWSFPLQTVSASESGFERNYQQTVIVPVWKFTLENTWHTNLDFLISPHKTPKKS